MSSCDSNNKSNSSNKEIESLKNRVALLEQRMESLIDGQMRSNTKKVAEDEGFETNSIKKSESYRQ